MIDRGRVPNRGWRLDDPGGQCCGRCRGGVRRSPLLGAQQSRRPGGAAWSGPSGRCVVERSHGQSVRPELRKLGARRDFGVIHRLDRHLGRCWWRGRCRGMTDCGPRSPSVGWKRITWCWYPAPSSPSGRVDLPLREVERLAFGPSLIRPGSRPIPLGDRLPRGRSMPCWPAAFRPVASPNSRASDRRCWSSNYG